MIHVHVIIFINLFTLLFITKVFFRVFLLENLPLHSLHCWHLSNYSTLNYILCVNSIECYIGRVEKFIQSWSSLWQQHLSFFSSFTLRFVLILSGISPLPLLQDIDVYSHSYSHRAIFLLWFFELFNFINDFFRSHQFPVILLMNV